jgi:hypothetical protein
MILSEEPSYGPRYSLIRIVDLIDVGLVLLQHDLDMSAIEFFLDLFPEGVNERDVKDFFREFDLINENKRADFESYLAVLRELLDKASKWQE